MITTGIAKNVRGKTVSNKSVIHLNSLNMIYIFNMLFFLKSTSEGEVIGVMTVFYCLNIILTARSFRGNIFMKYITICLLKDKYNVCQKDKFGMHIELYKKTVSGGCK